jgi:hypothetical protein
MWLSSSSESAMEMVFLRRWSVRIRGRPTGLRAGVSGRCCVSPNLRGHASGVW